MISRQQRPCKVKITVYFSVFKSWIYSHLQCKSRSRIRIHFKKRYWQHAHLMLSVSCHSPLLCLLTCFIFVSRKVYEERDFDQPMNIVLLLLDVWNTNLHFNPFLMICKKDWDLLDKNSLSLLFLIRNKSIVVAITRFLNRIYKEPMKMVHKLFMRLS